MQGEAKAALPWLLLESLGGPVRRAALVMLSAASISLGVILESLHPATWRRPTLRAELRRSLRQMVAGGFGTVLVTASLVGFGLVYQAVSWLAYAGQEGLAGQVLVTVLVREVAPVLVGLILLGRSGTVTVVEFGETKASGQLGVLEIQGLDPFTLLVLPRVVAMAVAGFTLGVVFLAIAISTGFLTGRLLGVVQSSFGEMLANLVTATDVADFVLFAVKLVLAGGLVAVACAITGMSSTRAETPSHLLPRGFVRGLLAILGSSILLSIATA
jgi:phospholipid/cholesterol/gamma-HCH transport system permease protein